MQEPLRRQHEGGKGKGKGKQPERHRHEGGKGKGKGKGKQPDRRSYNCCDALFLCSLN